MAAADGRAHDGTNERQRKEAGQAADPDDLGRRTRVALEARRHQAVEDVAGHDA